MLNSEALLLNWFYSLAICDDFLFLTFIVSYTSTKLTQGAAPALAHSDHGTILVVYRSQRWGVKDLGKALRGG